MHTAHSDKSSDIQFSVKEKSTLNAESMQSLAATPTNKADKPEKHKKRSKLCQLLWPKFYVADK